MNELDNILKGISQCDGDNCPVKDDCLHLYSTNIKEKLLSPFNLMEGGCEFFISKMCTTELIDKFSYENLLRDVRLLINNFKNKTGS